MKTLPTELRLVKREVSFLDMTMTDKELEVLRGDMRYIKFEKGENIFSASMNGNDHDSHYSGKFTYPCLFLVVNGTVKITIDSPFSTKSIAFIIENYLEEGVFGFEDERMFCSAEAHSETTILVIDRLAMNRILSNPHCLAQLFKLQSKRCAPYLKRIRVLMENAQKRIVVLLEGLYEKSTRQLPGPHPYPVNDLGRYNYRRPRMRINQIAEMVGIERETVSRMLNHDVEIMEVVKKLSPYIKIVGRGGKLTEETYSKRITEKKSRIRPIAEEIVSGFYERRGLKRDTGFRREVELVMAQLAMMAKKDFALTEPEKKMVMEKPSRLLSV